MINKFGFYDLAWKHQSIRAATLGADVIDAIDDSIELNQADNIDHVSKMYVMGQRTTFTPPIVGTHKIPMVKVNIDGMKTIGHVKIITE